MTADSSTTLDSPSLFSINNIKSYFLVLLGLLGISLMYHVITNIPAGGRPYDGGPPFRPVDTILQPPTGGNSLDAIWPLLGQLMMPSIFMILIAIVIFVPVVLLLHYFYREQKLNPNLIILIIIGVILIIATNLIHGWEILEISVSGSTEIYTDALAITDWVSFISDYELLQPDLTVHARTQPPGAVLTFYFLNVVFASPVLVAIALATVSTIFSVYFINGIFKKLFDEYDSKYTVVLFLVLPAVQVYYLANIYSIVATLAFGVLYFYLHQNKLVSILGSIICFFLGTFVSFLFIFMGLFLFIFETLNSYRENMFSLSSIKEGGFVSWLKHIVSSFDKVIIIGTVVLALYGLLSIGLGFDYVNAFLFASASENSTGFMLLSDPVFYFQTRIRNVLDILIFFGPVLTVLCFRGYKLLREQSKEFKSSAVKYNLVVASLIALSLLFLAGTPHHGETARICMFLLPFLLIPVLSYLKECDYSNREKMKLLVIVFLQAVIMQLIGTYVW
ncbi:MAG: hypothetical protein ACTSUB_07420 [Candidatus Thorarchaeota archaeon]